MTFNIFYFIKKNINFLYFIYFYNLKNYYI